MVKGSLCYQRRHQHNCCCPVYNFVLAFQFSFVCSVIKRRTRRFHHIRVISTFRSFRRALYTRGDVYVHGETTSVLDPGKNDRETVIRYQLPRRSADRHGVNLFWGKSGLLKHSSVHGLKFQEEVQRQFNNLQLCAMAKKYERLRKPREEWGLRECLLLSILLVANFAALFPGFAAKQCVKYFENSHHLQIQEGKGSF